MAALNFHHLRHFRAIALEENLTRAAERLNISQSALSVQLRALEESFGQPLFERRNKSLVLTPAGRVALDYAESIFRSGDELVGVMQHFGTHRVQVLRVGAVATLSRNFQAAVLRPLLGRPEIQLVLRSGSQRDLLTQLRAHTLDVVLSNLPVRRDAESPFHSRLLDEQPVSLVALKKARQKKFRFPDDLRKQPLILPSLDSNIRVGFDLLMEQHGIRPLIEAEVDDMALMRLLAREGAGLALVPPVVVEHELKSGLLVERYRISDLRENFYAITPTRRFPNPLLAELLSNF